MIPGLLLALAAQVATSAPAPAAYESLLNETSKAAQAGRIEQARLMIARAISQGAVGPRVDQLLGDIAYFSGNYSEALARYRQLATGPNADPSLCEHAGIAAIRTNELDDASKMLACATGSPRASARAWDARGVLADMQGDWSAADDSYARAEQLAPNDAAIVNNRGWSRLLRGDWAAALQEFQQAAALDPRSTRIQNNLELVQAALAAQLPQRRAGESDNSWAKRLNDAGVAAELLGQNKRAVAAFTQALEASGTWYERAANNLAKVRDQ